MFDKQAIQEPSKAEAISAAGQETASAIETDRGVLALPNDFTVHDLEKYLITRRRLRGAMTTSVLVDFARYVADHREAGATVFVSRPGMCAEAVLNLGTPAAPGHADNTAKYQPEQTAAYKALMAAVGKAGSQGLTQRELAEFMEDWSDSLLYWGGDESPIEGKHAIAAVRRITIEELRKVENAEQQLSASRTAFDQVRATGDMGLLPACIDFCCAPYQGLTQRTFTMRLAIRSGGKDPAMTLRIIKLEEHTEQMAGELAEQVAATIPSGTPVVIGSYSARA